MKTTKQEIWQKDKAHFIHPWSDLPVFEKEGSLIIDKAEKAHIYDIDGKKYLDGIGGLWCVNVGYGNQELAQAAYDQMFKMPYFSTFGHHTSEPAALLSAKLAEIAPKNLNRVLYSLSGSGANDGAIRVIHHYFQRLGQPKKKHVISRKKGYHGSTYLAMSLTGIDWYHDDFVVEDKWIHHMSCPDMYRGIGERTESEYLDFLATEFEQSINQIGDENIAAFIAEPIMGAGGVMVAPKGYHKRIYELCKKYDIFYISDEVVTAFCRLGHFFASEDLFGIQPDIINCAKGLTSGHIPLGASLISDQIYDVLNRPRDGKDFAHGFTYSGHPVSCAVGLKNIEILQRDNYCAHVLDVGGYFEEQLRKKLSHYPIVGDIRGEKLMMCVEFVQNKEKKLAFDSSVSVGSRIMRYAEEAGLIIRPIGAQIVMSPPLCITKEEIDFLMSVFSKSIEKVMDDLKKEQHL